MPDGQQILLTLLEEGQNATVLQLPAAPKTERETEDQKRAEYIGRKADSRPSLQSPYPQKIAGSYESPGEFCFINRRKAFRPINIPPLRQIADYALIGSGEKEAGKSGQVLVHDNDGWHFVLVIANYTPPK
jgi:hypothetical protein